MSDNRRKHGPKFIPHWKFCLFSKICVLNNLLGAKKGSYKFHSSRQKSLWNLLNCSSSCSMLNNSGKFDQILVFTGKLAFFSQKFFFSSTSYVLKNWSFYFHSNYQNTSWTLINCSLRFVILDNTRKNGGLIFFTGKTALSPKNLCFQQALRS